MAASVGPYKLYRRAFGSNCATRAQPIELVSKVVTPDGEVVAQTAQRRTVAACGSAEWSQSIAIPRPALWSPDSPNLYTLVQETRVNGATNDTRRTRFGIRTITVDAVNGLRVNGRRVVLRGRKDLGPGRSVSVLLRGAYKGSNPLPLAFTLDGRTCEAEVVGARTIEAVVSPPRRSSSSAPPAERRPKKPRKKPAPKPAAEPKVEKADEPVRPAPPPVRVGGFSVAI